MVSEDQQLEMLPLSCQSLPELEIVTDLPTRQSPWRQVRRLQESNALRPLFFRTTLDSLRNRRPKAFNLFCRHPEALQATQARLIQVMVPRLLSVLVCNLLTLPEAPASHAAE